MTSGTVTEAVRSGELISVVSSARSRLGVVVSSARFSVK
jgi:hypothetical protein